MNIKEFVSESLVQLIEGVQDAQNRTKETGAKINPMCRQFHHGETVSEDTGESNRVVTFDIAVSADKKLGASGEVKVWGIAAGGNKSSNASEVSRMQFSVYVILPYTELRPSS